MGKVQLKPPVSIVHLYLSDQQLLPHLVTPHKCIHHSKGTANRSLQIYYQQSSSQTQPLAGWCKRTKKTERWAHPWVSGILCNYVPRWSWAPGLWANLSLVREKSRRVTLETVTIDLLKVMTLF